jgi:CRP-like cAMP-binding protein
MIIPKISQDTLADMVGTTRARVGFFMNKFRKPGFIDYNRSCTCTVPSSTSSGTTRRLSDW